MTRKRRMPVIHSLNEWMHETWNFDYKGTDLPRRRVITPADRPTRRSREPRVGRRSWRSCRAHPAPPPVAGFRGPRSFAPA